MIDPLPVERVMRDAVRDAAEYDFLTYVDLSRRSGIAVGTIHNMMAFQTRGSLRYWQRLLDAAGVEIGSRRKAVSHG